VGVAARLHVLTRQDFCCTRCGNKLDGDVYEIDHVVPLSGGGSNGVFNLQALHPACHRRKSLGERG
jgi:5-methylcytosine-specific restriction endonuclease McrA